MPVDAVSRRVAHERATKMRAMRATVAAARLSMVPHREHARDMAGTLQGEPWAVTRLETSSSAQSGSLLYGDGCVNRIVFWVWSTQYLTLVICLLTSVPLVQRGLLPPLLPSAGVAIV